MACVAEYGRVLANVIFCDGCFCVFSYSFNGLGYCAYDYLIK